MVSVVFVDDHQRHATRADLTGRENDAEAEVQHVATGDLRTALSVLRLLPREALHRGPTPPPKTDQQEDVERC